MEQSAWRIGVGISRLALLAMPYANITHYSIIPTFHPDEINRILLKEEDFR